MTTSTDTIQDCFMQYNILSLSMFLFRVVHQTHLSLCFCLSCPPNTSPLPQNILLFYSDCCADTYYPDPVLTICTDVCLFLIISRHESCDIVHLPYEVSLIVPLPPRGCVCILQTRPYFAIAFFPHARVLHSPSLICEQFFFILAILVVFT